MTFIANSKVAGCATGRSPRSAPQDFSDKLTGSATHVGLLRINPLCAPPATDVATAAPCVAGICCGLPPPGRSSTSCEATLRHHRFDTGLYSAVPNARRFRWGELASSPDCFDANDVIRSEQHPVVPIAIRCPTLHPGCPPHLERPCSQRSSAEASASVTYRMACLQRRNRRSQAGLRPTRLFSLACDRHYQHAVARRPEQRGRVLSPDNCAR